MKRNDYYFPALEDINEAARVLKGVSAVTPLQLNENVSAEHNANVFLKREDLQVVRSYKLRGAYYKIKSLGKDELLNGIVCASAGNHAQGVAYSCSKLKIKGTIYMPYPTPSQKVEQVKMFGKNYVDIILYGDTFDEAKRKALIHSKINNCPFIHPFDDEKIIEGQGTTALEILAQSKKEIDYLFVPIGGGGLASGVSSVFSYLSPKTKIIGVEPRGAASMYESIRHGNVVKLDHIDKFVDGAAVQKVGKRNFNICKNLLNDIVLVDEGKLCETIIKLYNKDAIVIEPAGALTLAALDYYQDKIENKNVVCIISGGNGDITRTEEIMERALVYATLKHYFVIQFPQRAGALKEFVANVLGPQDDITHFEYYKKNNGENGTAVIGIQIKKKDDFSLLMSRMKKDGFFVDYLNDKPNMLSILVNT